MFILGTNKIFSMEVIDYSIFKSCQFKKLPWVAPLLLPICDTSA